MDWTQVGALGELGGAAAVVITLVYLARQVRQMNKQSMLTAVRHTYDSFNEWADMVAESESLASLIVRGRESFQGLDDTEKLRFISAHGHLMNIVEGWHFQVIQTSSDTQQQKAQLQNIAGFVRAYFDYPGVLQYWDQRCQLFSAEVRGLVDENTGDA